MGRKVSSFQCSVFSSDEGRTEGVTIENQWNNKSKPNMQNGHEVNTGIEFGVVEFANVAEGGEAGGTAALRWEEAEPWGEEVNGAELLEELEQVMRSYVVLPKWGAEVLALWVVHTYAFELREVSTYIGVESPERRCGKTTLLELLQKLVHRPAVTANISSPALYRVIEEWRPTLMIDEADTFLKRNDELRGILNAGYNRETAYVVRMEGKVGREPRSGRKGAGREWQVARFSCWCPKVIAMIGRLPETLADRCIVVRMQRKTAQEDCERLRNLQGESLRRKCVRFVRDQREAMAGAEPEAPSSLNDRAADIWEPLLAVADLAGGKWPEAARAAAVGLSAGKEETAMMTLLRDMGEIFEERNEGYIFSSRLVETLNGKGDRPWRQLMKGGVVTERWLAHRLREYGIGPDHVWINGEQGRGYGREDFAEVLRRYGPKREATE
jgi:putative DNA primase/helicase